MTCDPPITEFPPPLHFRIMEHFVPRGEGEDPVDFFLPVSREDYDPSTVGYIQQGFVEIEGFYGGGDTTSVGGKTLTLMEVFVPVLITWKHYTQDATTLDVTSSDESAELNVNDDSYTWPAGTFTDVGVTDGQWDGNFVLHEIV